jgi:hypothetical protein
MMVSPMIPPIDTRNIGRLKPVGCIARSNL